MVDDAWAELSSIPSSDVIVCKIGKQLDTQVGDFPAGQCERTGRQVHG